MLETRLKNHARSLGFDLVGIAPAIEADGFDRLKEWLDRGCRRRDAIYVPQFRTPPTSVVYPGGCSQRDHGWMVLRGSKFRQRRCERAGQPGIDRRDWSFATDRPRSSDRQGSPIRSRRRLSRSSLAETGPSFEVVGLESPGCDGRGVVDTAPLLERDFARRAGLGWFGKNTMLINKHRGSYFLLGALLVDIDLKADPPHSASHCGTCTACLDACPTQAFTAPGWLDARRCISYLTIELRTPVPDELRAGVGAWLFGCDICQEVCPWNSKKNAEAIALDPIELLGLSNEQFRIRFRNSAIWRTKRRGLLRNAALVLGNIGDQSALPALTKALDDAELLIRDAASWAISKIVERCQPGKGGG